MIDIFVKLGTMLTRGVPTDVATRAVDTNNWFSRSEIEYATRAIAETMLTREKIESWVAAYPTLRRRTTPNRVLIVMAGNIPLVGFFDLMCVLISGDEAWVKPSHKDRVLTEWIIEQLKEIEHSIPIFIYDGESTPDRVIATGGDSAVRHFGELFSDVKTLLRGSRHSVAVVGKGDDLKGLEQDIYLYSGLGCRNISMIFVPQGYDLSRIPKPKDINPKYHNNYLQNRALLTMTRAEFYDNGVSCLLRDDHFPQRLSTISIVEYDHIEEIEKWLTEQDNELQCVVSKSSLITHPRRVDFGEAQRPTLSDYADGVDTINFLNDK